MNELGLGYVVQPEQYAMVDDDCVLADSIAARKFFKQYTDIDGLIFLGSLYYATLQNAFMPVWLLVNVKTTKILAAVPIFRINNIDFYDGLQVTKTTVISHDTYFYWNRQLYAVVFTSTGEMIIRKVRCILSASDMFGIASLDDDVIIERCYPVKVYDENNGRFLAICWEIETENAYWFETICADDDVRLSHTKASDIISYPISIGDTVIIGDDYFTCCYDKVFDLYFKKTAFKATETDRAKEDIPLKDSPPKLPQLKVAFFKEKREKEMKEKIAPSKIVAFHPKK